MYVYNYEAWILRQSHDIALRTDEAEIVKR